MKKIKFTTTLSEDLLKEIQKQLKRGQWGEAIRLEVEDNREASLLKIIKKEVKKKEKIFII